MKEIILSVPIVNSEVLRGGNFVRFYLTRSTTFPSRLSDAPVCPESYIATVSGNLPEFRVPAHRVKKLARLSSILNSVIASFVLVWPAVQYGLKVNYPNKTALQPLIELCRWITHSYLRNGEEFVAKRLKLFAAWARYEAGKQLHAEPAKLTRFPFCKDGKPDFSKYFIGSISRCATSHKSLFRLSRMSRAFPPGDQKVIDQSLADHRALSTTTPITPAPLLRQFVAVPEKIFKNKDLKDIERESITISHSSCYERGTKSGGAAEELFSCLKTHFPGVQSGAYIPGDNLEDFIASCTLPREELFSQQDDGAFFLRSLNAFSRDAQFQVCAPPEGLPHQVIPVEMMAYRSCVVDVFPEVSQGEAPNRKIGKHRVIAIPDRGGFKVRVITAGEARLQSLSQTVRKAIYQKVLSQTPSKWSLIREGVEKFLRQLKRPNGPIVTSLGDWVSMSCDMKSATDRFPHDVVESINDGIESTLPDSTKVHPNWVAWRSLSGPQHLEYPDDETPILTTCGNLMGTAPSWVHLNLFNLTLVRVSWALWAHSRSRKDLSPLLNKGKFCNITELDKVRISEVVLAHLDREGFNPFYFPRVLSFNELTCIVGDDLGACCPFAVAALYEILLEMANGLTSFGKHYVQPWDDGNFMLIAEDYGLIDGDNMVVQPCESLRGIVSTASQFDKRENRPAWFQIGPTLEASVGRVRPQARRALCSLGHTALSEWRGSLLRKGLPVYMPVSMGGLGWPHPRGLEYAVRLISIKSLLAYQVMRGFRTDPVKFTFEILKTRATWMPDVQASAYSNLLNLIRDYMYAFRVSHEENGALAPLTEECPIGLFPTRWTLMADDGTRCLPLAEVLDKIVLNGLTVGFLCKNTRGEHEEPYKEVNVAVKRYRSRVNSLISMRTEGGGQLSLYSKRTDYVSKFKEDEVYLKSIYIYIGDTFEETFPTLAATILGSD